MQKNTQIKDNKCSINSGNAKACKIRNCLFFSSRVVKKIIFFRSTSLAKRKKPAEQAFNVENILLYSAG